MAAPIGKQVKALMAASDSIQRQPMQACQLARIAGLEINASSATRLCRRAEKYGLAKCSSTTPLRFQSIEGWDGIKPEKAMPSTGIRPVKAQAMPSRIINSVWSLGL